MPFRHARARLPDCISIIGQIRRDLYVRHHNEMWEAGEMFTGHGTTLAAARKDLLTGALRQIANAD
jgi:hypothetical protein